MVLASEEIKKLKIEKLADARRHIWENGLLPAAQYCAKRAKEGIPVCAGYLQRELGMREYLAKDALNTFWAMGIAYPMVVRLGTEPGEPDDEVPFFTFDLSLIQAVSTGKYVKSSHR